MATDDTDWLYNDDIDVPLSSEVKVVPLNACTNVWYTLRTLCVCMLSAKHSRNGVIIV